jgi:hypothetical protein
VILKRIGDALRARDWTAFAIEFAIVVVGVFVAIQAQNWNQERKDRQLEQAYISRLVDETKASIEIVDQLERIYEAKNRFILALRESSLEEVVGLDPGRFMEHLDYSSYKAISEMRSETFHELESSGRLLLLRDAALRSALAGNVAHFAVTREVLREPIGEYRRLLFEAVPGRSYYEWVSTRTTDLAPVLVSLEAFRNDPRFEAAANAEVTYGADVLFWLRDYRRRLEHILSLLQAAE